MKRIIVTSILSLSALCSLAQGITSENRELARPTFVSFRKAADAKFNVRDTSVNYQTLNGEWRIMVIDDKYKVDTLLFAPGKAIGNLKSVTLPSAAQLSLSTQAVFSSKAYTFLNDAPEKGEYKLPSTAKGAVAYMRDFFVPFDFMDKALFIHIGAAQSAVTLYINGRRVGYSTDSRNPAEFDITKYMVRGRNRVAMLVEQNCEGSYLEDQTDWRLSGINREVFLFAQPKIRVRDYMVRTTLDPTHKNGLLETALLIKTQLLNPHKVTVFYDLYDPKGELVNQASKEVELGMRGEDTVRFTATILDVKHWNAETPNLYTIAYSIKRIDRFTEYITVKSGFRTVGIEKGELLINGKAIKLKGVNLSEFSPITGNVQSEEELRKTLTDIKLAGFNAVRTDGYPLSDAFYRLCDELGLYVQDVANINSQGISRDINKGGTLANNPAWCADFKYRVNNTYQRNKAHTSVIMWGLGDNAGNGYNMYEAYMMLKAQEQMRPVVYNGAGLEFNTDIYCPDYPNMEKISEIKGYMDNQPIIISRCEFDPAIWTTPGVQGGFISRWVSPSITTSGKFATLSDEYKLTPQSSGAIKLTSAQDKLAEISDFFANVKIKAIDLKKGIFEFENRLDFTSLDRLEVTYDVIQNGKVKRHGLINVAAAPGETIQVQLPKYSYNSKAKVVIKVSNLAQYTF